MHQSTEGLLRFIDSPDRPVELAAASVDAFVARMEALEAQTRRIRPVTPLGKKFPRSSPPAGAGGREKIELVLYTSTASEKCQKAVRTVRAVLDQYDMSQVKFSVLDLAAVDSFAAADGVIFTPTLVKRAPGPRTWIVGNLDQPDLLIELLDVSGVDRRKP